MALDLIRSRICVQSDSGWNSGKMSKSELRKNTKQSGDSWLEMDFCQVIHGVCQKSLLVAFKSPVL